MDTINYLDSRTKEEREKDSKIESITTTSEQLKQKALKEFENLFGETRGLTGLGYQDFSLVERDGEKARVFVLCHKDVKSFLLSKLNELEKAVREETIEECLEILNHSIGKDDAYKEILDLLKVGKLKRVK